MAPRPRTSRLREALGVTSAMTALGVTLSACYGGPPPGQRMPPEVPAQPAADGGTTGMIDPPVLER
jgi:hypothetical protein